MRGPLAALAAALAVVAAGSVPAPALTVRRLDFPEAWSPDGRLIAFERAGTATCGGHTIQPDGRGLRELPGCGGSYAWARDGRLAFSRDTRPYGDPGISVVDGRGLVHAVTKPVAAVDGAPEWSPSGDWILFSRSAGHRRDGPRTKSLWIVHPDGTGARRIKTGDTADGSGSWAPDGRRIAFARKARLRGADLVVVDITTGHVHRLTSHADNGYPAWSPTGETIMFERAGDLDTSSRVHLWSIRADGSRLHDLGPIANGMQAAWSPDGRRFAFTDDGGPDSAIYLVRADGSGRRQLVPGAAQGDQDPVWSPDSRRVAFGRFNSSGGISVHVVDVTGRNTLRLTY